MTIKENMVGVFRHVAQREPSLPTIPNQAELWDRQHATRGVFGPEGKDLLNTPNQSAVYFASLLREHSHLIEVGSASGRDARSWAVSGHTVDCVDISSVALKQLRDHAQKQGISNRIKPHRHDVSSGRLPRGIRHPAVGFYARSALHVGDDTMDRLALDIDRRLSQRGVVLIEGKHEDDEKIKRSHRVGQGLALDSFEGGHLRRVWTEEYMEHMCNLVKWDLEDVYYDGGFIRMVAIKK